MIDRIINIIKRIFSLKDLRNKIILTFALIVVYRVLAHIPLPGVDASGLASFFQNNQAFGLLDLFSGGSVSKFSLAMLGVGPYITASIIIQLLTVAVPALEELQKEGEYGKQKINQYIRYLSIPLALTEAYGLVRLLQSQKVISTLSMSELTLVLVVATAGSVFAMWLGEIISERGIGNGLSLLIAVGIVAGIPGQVSSTSQILENKIVVGGEIILAMVAMTMKAPMSGWRSSSTPTTATATTIGHTDWKKFSFTSILRTM